MPLLFQQRPKASDRRHWQQGQLRPCTITVGLVGTADVYASGQCDATKVYFACLHKELYICFKGVSSFYEPLKKTQVCMPTCMHTVHVHV